MGRLFSETPTRRIRQLLFPPELSSTHRAPPKQCRPQSLKKAQGSIGVTLRVL